MEQPCLKAVLQPDPVQQNVHQSRRCPDWQGQLPTCAPLANPYVPFQQETQARYEAPKGLIRGTLFLGLDLPYLGMVNETEKGDSGLAELQALSFALTELGLYLDTHTKDAEAVALFKAYAELYQQGLEAYQTEHGPLTQIASVPDGIYRWTNGPWPWEYDANLEE